MTTDFRKLFDFSSNFHFGWILTYRTIKSTSANTSLTTLQSLFASFDLQSERFDNEKPTK